MSSQQQTVDSKQLVSELYEVAGHGLQIDQWGEDEFTVWLSIEEDSVRDGLCIGAGSTRRVALGNAGESLSAVCVLLQQLAVEVL